MGELIPNSQRILTDNTNFVGWTQVSGANSGDFFYLAIGLPTYAASLGAGTQPTVTVDGKGTKITLTGTVDPETTYHLVSWHGPGKPLRFS